MGVIDPDFPEPISVHPTPDRGAAATARGTPAVRWCRSSSPRQTRHLRNCRRLLVHPVLGVFKGFGGMMELKVFLRCVLKEKEDLLLQSAAINFLQLEDFRIDGRVR